MGYSIYFNGTRDCGYGVPALCDHPGCNELIDRGLYYKCGEISDHGCGLFFCSAHLKYGGEKRDDAQLCSRCYHNRHRTFPEKPDIPQWIRFKLRDRSWKEWREENQNQVGLMRAALGKVAKSDRR